MQNIHRTVRFHLIMGKPSQALDSMIGFLTHSDQHDLLSDTILLKNQYESAAHNYRQGMMPRTEFDLIQNRTVNALQAILKDVGTDQILEGRTAVSDEPLPVRQSYWAVLGAAVVVIALAGWLVFKSQDKRIAETPKTTGVDTPIVKRPETNPKVSSNKVISSHIEPPEIVAKTVESPARTIETEPATILYLPDFWGEADILADGKKIGFTSSGRSNLGLSVPKNIKNFQLVKDDKTCNGQKSTAGNGKLVIHFPCH